MRIKLYTTDVKKRKVVIAIFSLKIIFPKKKPVGN